MKLTWHGHSAFTAEYAGAKILFDPFFMGEAAETANRRKVTDGATHVLLTHGHDDHIGSALEICQENGAMLVANFEICLYLVGKGLSDTQINPANFGRTLDCGGFTTTFVKAEHSSSSQTENGNNVYLGNPGGLVLHSADEKTLYHMGDTDIFGDMALIQELHQPEVGLVPIGDRFTMGGAVAALACRRYFDFGAIIPCHYGSFPIIDQDADKFLAAMEEKASIVKAISPGEAASF